MEHIAVDWKHRKQNPLEKWLKWLASIVGGGFAVDYASQAIYNELNKEWTLPPGAVSKGRIQAIVHVGLWKMDGEKTTWYGTGGEWESQDDWGFDKKNPIPPPTYPLPMTYYIYNPINSDDYNRDYHYYDYEYEKLVWDEDNQIWTSGTNANRHVYGDTDYNPDCINDFRNNGEHGWFYPDHGDYKKGKSGYIIVHGHNTKNYLSHEFVSRVNAGKNNEGLKAEAKLPKYSKDKYSPIAIVYVSDMSYEDADGDGKAGWTYTRRAPSEAHSVTRTLSAVEKDAEDLNDKEYIPLNAREEDTDYQFNKSIVYWSARTEWRTEDVKPNNTDLIFENQRIPFRYEVLEQQIDHFNW